MASEREPGNDQAREKAALLEMACVALTLRAGPREAALDGLERAGLRWDWRTGGEEGLAALAARAEGVSPGALAQAAARGAPLRGKLMRAQSGALEDPMAALAREGGAESLRELGRLGGDLDAGEGGLLAEAAGGLVEGMADRIRALTDLRGWGREERKEACARLRDLRERSGPGLGQRECWRAAERLIAGEEGLFWERLPEKRWLLRGGKGSETLAELAAREGASGFWRGLELGERALGAGPERAERARRLLELALDLSGSAEGLKALAGARRTIKALAEACGGIGIGPARAAAARSCAALGGEAERFGPGTGGKAWALAIQEICAGMGAGERAAIGRRAIEALDGGARRWRMPGKDALAEIPEMLAAIEGLGGEAGLGDEERGRWAARLALGLACAQAGGGLPRARASGTEGERALLEWASLLAGGLGEAGERALGERLAEGIREFREDRPSAKDASAGAKMIADALEALARGGAGGSAIQAGVEALREGAPEAAAELEGRLLGMRAEAGAPRARRAGL